MDIVWSPEAQIHMWEAHEVTPAEATEAIEDIDAVWYEPDPASKSGLTSRVVGYSHSRVRILCVVVLPTDEGYQVINAWPANATYRRIYREAQDDD